MSYAAIRDGLLGQLRLVSGFGVDNVLYGDHQMLNAGSQRAVVVSFAQMTAMRDAFAGQYTREWRFTVRTFTAYDADVPSTRAAQDANRDLILARLQGYPLLGGAAGVQDARVESITPDPEQHMIGNASFFAETLALLVIEDFDAAEQE